MGIWVDVRGEGGSGAGTNDERMAGNCVGFRTDRGGGGTC